MNNVVVTGGREMGFPVFCGAVDCQSYQEAGP